MPAGPARLEPGKAPGGLWGCSGGASPAPPRAGAGERSRLHPCGVFRTITGGWEGNFGSRQLAAASGACAGVF